MIPIKDDNPIRGTPWMTITLIAANVLVYLHQISLGPLGEAFVYRYGAIPYEILHFRELPFIPLPYQTPFSNFLTLFTSMFIHGGFLHLAGNMLYLWIFGDNVEYIMGRFRFLVFYLLTGLAAALTHIIMSPNSTVPMVGASGAISGVLGAYFVRFPGARVIMLVPIFFFIEFFSVPAIFALGFWFLMQLANALFTFGLQTSGGVAWFAHIGGFLAGAFLVSIFQRRYVRAWW